jgi:5-methylcytosine-specific restriction endonuclease McrA
MIDIHKMVEEATQSADVRKTLDLIEDITKKGYNQGGKNNNNYKNGISTYAQKKKGKCQSCGSTKNLMVHHKDGNRKNNDASNLKTLCWSCHEKITNRK